MAEEHRGSRIPGRSPSGRPGPGGRPGAGDGPGAIRGGWRLLLWFLLGTLIFLWLENGFGSGKEPTRISYSAFLEHVESGNVARVTATGDQLDGAFEEPIRRVGPEGDTISASEFRTLVPEWGGEGLLERLESQGVEIDVQADDDSPWWPVFVSLLPFLLLFVVGWYILRRMQGRGQNLFSVGKSRAKLYDRRAEQTKFDDVANLEGAKEELREIVDFLKDPSRFRSLGGEMPTGVLLVGPPGTGKTLLARAVAGEADVPFFSITGSDFMEMFVGVGASRVRDMFDTAKKTAPSIIFIDELDSIGRRRGAGLGGGHDEREQTLNQLLSELDGFEPATNVIVMAATNRPDILDPALMRPGRFDRQITVNLPTAKAREHVLAIHARNKPLAGDVDLEKLARGTPGMSGADLENLLNEAALTAARKDKKAIEQEDIEEARDRVMLGLERRGLTLSDEELELLAYHEAGHALVAAVLPHADPIHKVTIVPRGRAMGTTHQLPEREKYVYRREYMLDRLAVTMGGRAAEELVFGTATSGAEEDFRQAAGLARKMVLDWGMSEALGPMVAGARREQVFLGEEIAQRREFSEDTAREVDEEVGKILDEAAARARGVLLKHREALNAVARRLLEKEEIPGEEVSRLLESASAHREVGHS